MRSSAGRATTYPFRRFYMLFGGCLFAVPYDVTLNVHMLCSESASSSSNTPVLPA